MRAAKIGVAVLASIAAIASWIHLAERQTQALAADLITVAQAKPFISVKEWLGRERGTVCALFPYQMSVETREPYADSINAHLQANGFIAEDSKWALAVANEGGVRVMTFGRRDIEFRTPNEFDLADMAEVGASGFKITACTALDRAGFFRTKDRDRLTVIFGSLS